MTEETPKIKNQFSDLSKDELTKLAADFKDAAGSQNIDIAKTFGIVEAGITEVKSDDAPLMSAATVATLQKFADSLSMVGKPEDVDSKNSDPLTKKFETLMTVQIKNATAEIQKVDKDFPVETILSLNCDSETKLNLLTDVALPLAGRHLEAIQEFKAAFSDKKPEDVADVTTLDSKNSEGSATGKSTVAKAMENLGYKPDA